MRPPILRRRRAWPRGPIVTRILTVGLALLAGTLTAAIVARAEARADAYGSHRAVAVTRHRLEAGTTITSDDIERRDLPDALVPAGAVDEPTGRVVVATILSGEPIVDERVAPDGLHGAAALVPAGRRAIAVPLDGPPPPLRVGDRADLVGGRDATNVATGAVVVDVNERAVTLAVRDDEVTATARAVLDGSVVVVLSGAL